VTDGNERATALYERLGFRSFGVEPKAICVGGTYFGKNHMVIDLTS
jgi:RimJ/RimL family protein N-acetyltransferase